MYFILELIMDYITEQVFESGVTDIIYEYKKLLEYQELIENYSSKWDEICYYEKLSDEFIKLYYDNIDWNTLSLNLFFDENFIEEHFDKLNLRRLSSRKYSIEFLRRNKDRLDWSIIMIKKYDEEILIEFIDYIDIYMACTFQKLSENFIENHINLFNDRMYWYYLFQHQEFSSEFKQRHEHRSF